MKNRFDLLNNDGVNAIDGISPDFFRDKKILITGASGIVGTCLIHALKNLKETYRISLNIYAVVSREIPRHLIEISSNEYINFFIGDLANEFFCAKLPPSDIIIHAATYGQPGMFMQYPEITLKLNTYVTLILLERMLKPGGRMLFISSSEVYSGLSNSPFNELQIGTTTPNHQRSCYIEAKRCGEAIVNAYRGKGINALSARLSLAYGPGTKVGDKRVLNNFIEKAIINREIKLIDEGTAHRTYCYISDAVNMMLKILFEGKEPVYNVGGVSTLTISELAKKIGKICNVNVSFPENNSFALLGAPEDVRLDLSRYNNEFGEKNFIGIEEGLKNTIEWQKSIYK
jgi:nucleoside-diphosphate-sugar epimerase